MRFSDPIDEYVVVKLRPERFLEPGGELGEGFFIRNGKLRGALKRAEKEVIRSLFDRWMVPYLGLIPGWRKDSPVYMFHEKILVGAVYLCDKNEFGEPGWGQVHYVWIRPEYQGKGLYRLLFREAIRKAREWGLEGVYVNSDRYLLPEMYERWGAEPYRRIQKSPQGKSPLRAAGVAVRILDRLVAVLARRIARR